MKLLTTIRNWLLPILLLIFGLFLALFVVGHSFLGLILCGIAALMSCYKLLKLLQQSHPLAARILRTLLSTLLIFGIILYAITLIPICRGAAGNPDAACDYIVVLGAKVNATHPSLTLRERIDAAYDYLTVHPDTIAVLSGGQGADEGISEAQCMFNELTAMGISAERLWMEDKSTSTQENLNFSLALIEEKTGSRPITIGLVSSEFHLYRAGLFAADCGMTAIGIPAHTSWLSLRLNYYLREVAAVWKYMILGG